MKTGEIWTKKRKEFDSWDNLKLDEYRSPQQYKQWSALLSKDGREWKDDGVRGLMDEDEILRDYEKKTNKLMILKKALSALWVILNILVLFGPLIRDEKYHDYVALVMMGWFVVTAWAFKWLSEE